MPAAGAPELWGGVECTVNRVGDRRIDQIARTGHMARLSDLDRFADLGIRALRFPLLWEHVQPDRNAEPDWRWADEALPRLRERGVRAIVGLLHHGFGPRWIDVRDASFAEELGRFARMVAERYPWVDAYTPVNEPLTTARFGALYGHWYPHARDAGTFARVLLSQLAGVACAMREIRAVNPAAILVQTEDLGQVASTPALAYQRDFENERRWLTWDILCGTLAPGQRCWEYLCGDAPVEDALLSLRDAPCAPDVIGVNHYITSERFLDERVERYSLDEIGGNGRDVYADVAQVHADRDGRASIHGLLRQTWDRYRLPIAVTECHMGCTREEQLRWLRDVWNAARLARSRGADVRAVTSWALLGSFDWNSLLTRESGHYEPGAFDVRAPVPRPTALATMVRALATRGSWTHPALDAPGWWSRASTPRRARRIAIPGTGDPLAREVAAACESRGLAHTVVDPATLHSCLDDGRTWAVIDVQGDALTASRLAEHCSKRGVRFVRLTPDIELDAEPAEPPPGHPDSLLIRMGEPFGFAGDDDFVLRAMLSLASGDPVDARDDVIVTPAYVADVVHTMLDLLIDDERGEWTLSHGTSLTPRALLARAAERAGLATPSMAPARVPHRAPPSGRGWPMPSLDDALDRYMAVVRSRIDARSRSSSGSNVVTGVSG